MKFKTEIHGNKVHVFTPYNTDFVRRIKLLCGHWNEKNRCWTIPDFALDDARAAMREIYGEDDLSDVEKEIVTLRFCEEVSELRGPVQLFGRVIATAYGRDSGAKPGDEVAFIRGGPTSGGSRKNWETIIPKGCVIRIFNVPVSMVHDSELPDAVVLVSVSPQEKKEDQPSGETIDSKIRAALESGKIRTDSDVEDFAEEHGLVVGDVEKMIWNILSEGTSCAGCKNVAYMNSGMYPCNSCTRNKQFKDMYEERGVSE